MYPPNLWLDDQPVDHETYEEEVTQARIEAMVEDDIWVPPYWEREE
ncbi:hypothetical protein [Halalkalicoccus jeotgali]|uniref:Uncharacterized protein n=1 Tax=Halalkalicoccus jeotgali (strain DSM 18796 / CECT 7217 / JCM 14584 / KCTC 4019 / B3) TaxID=795797 RepID=D8J7F9_HALJB|nr:hypothetical protein [Halalkalicoccus jeotgali]ADJ14054.1 hypothetical protein HacjB3_03305 [Halalkalicoccus jeotgali B3]ELY33902.1 hypothetical protein C497_16002 [Halalkalicoccus jeotgali B3]